RRVLFRSVRDGDGGRSLGRSSCFQPTGGSSVVGPDFGIEGGGTAAPSSTMSGGDGSASSGAEPVSGAAYLIVFVRRTRPHVGPGAGGSNVAPGGRAAHERVGDAG